MVWSTSPRNDENGCFLRLSPLRRLCPGRAERVGERMCEPMPGERSARLGGRPTGGNTRLRSRVSPPRPAPAGVAPWMRARRLVPALPSGDTSAPQVTATPRAARRSRFLVSFGRQDAMKPSQRSWRAFPAYATRTQARPVPSASQVRALAPPERHETPDPVRSNALNVRFHCVGRQGRFTASGSRGVEWSRGHAPGPFGMVIFCWNP